MSAIPATVTSTPEGFQPAFQRVQQSGDFDCAFACIAMIAGTALDDVRDVAIKKFRHPAHGPYWITQELIASLADDLPTPTETRTMKRIGYALGTLLIAIPLVSQAEPLSQGELVKLDTRPGVTQGIFITTPQTPPKAVVVLYSGGPGRLHLDTNGPTKSEDTAPARAVQWIREADGLLVTAGTGMGVDSGQPDFRCVDGLWRAYPALKAAGMLLGPT